MRSQPAERVFAAGENRSVQRDWLMERGYARPYDNGYA